MLKAKMKQRDRPGEQYNESNDLPKRWTALTRKSVK